MHFRVLDAAGEDIEERLLAAAVEYGQAQNRQTFTAYFLGTSNDAEYLQALGLRPSIDLIVLEKSFRH
jgi:hypothetical protein